jgi:hypothetical protein
MSRCAFSSAASWVSAPEAAISAAYPDLALVIHVSYSAAVASRSSGGSLVHAGRSCR